MDIPKLNTIILASPKSDIIQSVGRILRQKPEDRKHIPKIIDICDDFSAFSKQALKRQAYYKKCKYSIQIINHIMTRWKCTYIINHTGHTQIFSDGIDLL